MGRRLDEDQAKGFVEKGKESTSANVCCWWGLLSSLDLGENDFKATKKASPNWCSLPHSSSKIQWSWCVVLVAPLGVNSFMKTMATLAGLDMTNKKKNIVFAKLWQGNSRNKEFQMTRLPPSLATAVTRVNLRDYAETDLSDHTSRVRS